MEFRILQQIFCDFKEFKNEIISGNLEAFKLIYYWSNFFLLTSKYNLRKPESKFESQHI